MKKIYGMWPHKRAAEMRWSTLNYLFRSLSLTLPWFVRPYRIGNTLLISTSLLWGLSHSRCSTNACLP